jgi:HAD superfamily hydrolase (TIGR01509 family)
MSYKAILFDLDGTLVDSERLHLGTWEEIFKAKGLFFDAHWYHQWIGITDINMSRQVTATYLPQLSWQELLTEKRDRYQERIGQYLQPLPGVREGLQALQHLPLAVATMSSRSDAEISLRATGIDHYFKGMITADEVTHFKPDPEPYRMAAALLGFAPEYCIAVEDSVPGVTSAKSAGCFTIGVANSVAPEQLAIADLVLENSAAAFAHISALLFPLH